LRTTALALVLLLGCTDEPWLYDSREAAGGSIGVIPAAGGAAGAGGSGDAGSSSTSPRVQTGGPFVTLAAQGDDGTLYFGSWDGRLYAVSEELTVRWTFATNGRVDAPPAVLNDRVLVASWDGTVSALGLAGTLLWTFYSGAPVDVAPSVAPDGTVYFANDAGRLFALDASGNLVGQAELPAPPTTDVALDGEGDDTLLRIGTAGGRLMLLNAALEPVAEVALAAGDPMASLALDRAGNAFFGTSAGALCSVTRAGALRFCRELTYAPVFPPAIAEDGTIYAGATDRIMYALEPDGRRRWATSLPGSVLSAPGLGRGGEIFVGARHLLLGSDSGSFETLAELDLGHAPVIGTAGRLFVGDDQGGFVAIDGARPGLELADAPWPAERGGFRRLGRRSP
jgi:outer membrane protein assembly factor BamB